MAASALLFLASSQDCFKICHVTVCDGPLSCRRTAGLCLSIVDYVFHSRFWLRALNHPRTYTSAILLRNLWIPICHAIPAQLRKSLLSNSRHPMFLPNISKYSQGRKLTNVNSSSGDYLFGILVHLALIASTVTHASTNMIGFHFTPFFISCYSRSVGLL